jgi:hypothetical protein
VFSIINFRKAILVFTFILILLPLFSQENQFTWNVGTFEIVGTYKSDSDLDSTPDMILTLGYLQYHSLGSPWTFQISLYESKFYGNDISYGILSPVEVNYNLFGKSWILLGPYAKGGVGYCESNFYPYCEGGFKVGLLLRESFLHYSWRNSLCLGYTNGGDLNLSLQFDLGSIGTCGLLSTSF